MSSSYRELVVWKKSFQLTKAVYALCNNLPKSEQFSLISQMQRCAVSIPSNIAEGQQRQSSKEFKQFIGIARGSATELSTQLLLTQSIFSIDVTNIITDLEQVQKMLYSLQSKIN
jgi:four helix bundle protein